VTTNGALIENVDVTGNIDIDADNVTLRNFRINANGAFYGIQVRPGAKGVLIEDGEITNSASAGVFGQGSATYRRLHIHDHNKDGMKIRGAGSLVEYCFVTRLGLQGFSLRITG